MTTETKPLCLDGMAHWWQIDTPHGEFCEAKCKRCEKTRTYRASLESIEAVSHGKPAKRFIDGAVGVASPHTSVFVAKKR